MAHHRSSVMSTTSGLDTLDPYEKSKKKSVTTFLFGATSKKEGGYTSLFHRKLLPPLGFYREADKYCKLKARFAEDPEKLEALDEMWHDYKKFQIRKRFRWPPILFLNKFFWTTGYYADYQKSRRARRIRKPGEDSSDEELETNVVGAFLTAARDHDDINLQEFERYRKAKGRPRMTWLQDMIRDDKGKDGDGCDHGKSPIGLEGKSTVTRLFGSRPMTEKDKSEMERAAKENADREKAEREKAEKEKLDKPKADKERADKEASDAKAGKGKGKSDKDKKKIQSTVEEEETVVEYTIIKNPNKKKSKKGSKNKLLTSHIPGLSEEDAEAATDGTKVINMRHSIVKTQEDANTGEIISKEVKETVKGKGK